VLKRLNLETRAQLDALLRPTGELSGSIPSEPERSPLQELRSGPGRASLETLDLELRKLSRIRALGLPPDLFVRRSPQVVASYDFALPRILRPARVPGRAGGRWLRSPLPDHLGEEHLRVGIWPRKARRKFNLSEESFAGDPQVQRACRSMAWNFTALRDKRGKRGKRGKSSRPPFSRFSRMWSSKQNKAGGFTICT
jgi:hypothetical protein